MLTQIHNRLLVKDVDGLVMKTEALTNESYQVYKNAVQFVPYDYDSSEKGLSDNFGDFMQMLGHVPSREKIRESRRKVKDCF